MEEDSNNKNNNNNSYQWFLEVGNTPQSIDQEHAKYPTPLFLPLIVTQEGGEIKTNTFAIGRSLLFGKTDKRIGRRQLELTINETNQQATVQRFGVNPSILEQNATKKKVALNLEEKYPVLDGDKIYLIPDSYPIVIRSIKTNTNLFPTPFTTTDTTTRTTPPTSANTTVTSTNPIVVDLDEESNSATTSTNTTANNSNPNKPELPPLVDLSPRVSRKRNIDQLFDSESDDDYEVNTTPTSNSPTYQPSPFSSIYRLNKLAPPPASLSCFSQPQSEVNTVSITELFNIPDISTIILTTYKVELPWLYNKIPILKNVKVILIHGETNQLDGKSVGLQESENLRIIKPILPFEYGVNHGKTIWIFTKSILRVVISTANLIEKDYDKKTQGIWYQDFSKHPQVDQIQKQDSSTSPNNNTTNYNNNNSNNNDNIINSSPAEANRQNAITEFGSTLIDYLVQLGLDVAPFSLNDYNFTVCPGIHLITSVPGYHTGSKLYNYGHMKLRTLLNPNSNSDTTTSTTSKSSRTKVPRLNSQSGEQKGAGAIYIQCSSIGALSEAWLFSEFGKSLCTSSGATPVHSATEMKIMWPSVQMVKESFEGWSGGYSLCLASKNNKEFLKKYLKKFEPSHANRRYVCPHIKTYFQLSGKSETRAEWLMLTSANLSKAAWGELQKKNEQLMIRHFEIGLLFMKVESRDQLQHKSGKEKEKDKEKEKEKEKEKDKEKEKEEEEGIELSNEGRVEEGGKRIFPIPFKINCRDFTGEGENTPWVFDIKYTNKDRLGTKYTGKSSSNSKRPNSWSQMSQ